MSPNKHQKDLPIFIREDTPISSRMFFIQGGLPFIVILLLRLFNQYISILLFSSLISGESR